MTWQELFLGSPLGRLWEVRPHWGCSKREFCSDIISKVRPMHLITLLKQKNIFLRS